MSAPQREYEVTLPIGWPDGSGRVHRKAVLRKMRGHEEALLYDPSLTPARLVTELIRGCLVRLGDQTVITAEIVSEMFSADRSYLVVELRRITLGDHFAASYGCPTCGGETAVIEDLGRINVRRLAEDEGPRTVEVELTDGYQDPDGASHLEVRLRLPRGVDEDHVARSSDKDPLKLRDALLLRCIESFGSVRRAALESYGIKILRDLTLGDRRRLYAAIESETPGVDFRRSVRCSSCGVRFETVMEASGFFVHG
jgi:ribosomal protein S14